MGAFNLEDEAPVRKRMRGPDSTTASYSRNSAVAGVSSAGAAAQQMDGEDVAGSGAGDRAAVKEEPAGNVMGAVDLFGHEEGDFMGDMFDPTSGVGILGSGCRGYPAGSCWR